MMTSSRWSFSSLSLGSPAMMMVKKRCKYGRKGTSARCMMACASLQYGTHIAMRACDGVMINSSRASGMFRPAGRLAVIVCADGAAKQQIQHPLGHVVTLLDQAGKQLQTDGVQHDDDKRTVKVMVCAACAAPQTLVVLASVMSSFTRPSFSELHVTLRGSGSISMH